MILSHFRVFRTGAAIRKMMRDQELGRPRAIRAGTGENVQPNGIVAHWEVKQVVKTITTRRGQLLRGWPLFRIGESLEFARMKKNIDAT